MEQVITALQVVPLEWYLLLSFLLFGIGVAGALLRRNVLVVIMCLELMLNSVNLLLVALSVYYGSTNAQIFVFFIMLVAAAEVSVGLAIMVQMKRNVQGIDINQLNQLKW